MAVPNAIHQAGGRRYHVVKPKPVSPPPNPLRDSWKPADKAAEAQVDNPEEFGDPGAAEDSTGPVPTKARKTSGEA